MYYTFLPVIVFLYSLIIIKHFFKELNQVRLLVRQNTKDFTSMYCCTSYTKLEQVLGRHGSSIYSLQIL